MTRYKQKLSFCKSIDNTHKKSRPYHKSLANKTITDPQSQNSDQSVDCMENVKVLSHPVSTLPRQIRLGNSPG